MKKKYSHLSFEERFVIEKLVSARRAIREIAKFLSRSPNTVSSEIRKNMINGSYRAERANRRAYFRRYRSKHQCMKVVMDTYLHHFVDRKLRERWSPEQIAGYLKTEIGISCSAKAIYKFAKKRCYDRYLFWGWNNRKRGRKRYAYKTERDGRKYIDERPPVDGLSHFEMDFVVSRQSTWVFLVVVDRLSRKTWVERLPNRKRVTVVNALSRIFRGQMVRSITTDNDIAFVCWREIETLLQTQVYFTHPYHSWEKGLVENTNRWIRCFVAKGRDIGTVTEYEMWEILSFLNDRPRKVIGFKLPSVYHYQMNPLS
jgi:transposase, IS30 family